MLQRQTESKVYKWKLTSALKQLRHLQSLQLRRQKPVSKQQRHKPNALRSVRHLRRKHVKTKFDHGKTVLQRSAMRQPQPWRNGRRKQSTLKRKLMHVSLRSRKWLTKFPKKYQDHLENITSLFEKETELQKKRLEAREALAENKADQSAQKTEEAIRDADIRIAGVRDEAATQAAELKTRCAKAVEEMKTEPPRIQKVNTERVKQAESAMVNYMSMQEKEAAEFLALADDLKLTMSLDFKF